MKNRVRWIMLIMVALVASNAWAVWNPNAEVRFLMDFENNNNAVIPPTTTDGVLGLVGTLADYNTAGFDVFQESGIIGTSADFNQFNDKGVGIGRQPTNTLAADYNDSSFFVSLLAPYNDPVFEFGSAALTQAGFPGHDQMTMSFWFNVPSISSGGTFFGHKALDDVNNYWEVRVNGGKLQFHHNKNCLRFETGTTLDTLGVTANTWHHGVVVVDRTNCAKSSIASTSQTSKMYIDGLESPVIITYLNTDNMQIDTAGGYASPLRIGSGDRNFDGLLDEIRIYSRVLSASEVSILSQYNPSVTHAVAVNPIRRSSNVAITTGLSWVPAALNGSTIPMTVQNVFFGTSPESLAWKVNTGTTEGASVATNANIGGPLTLASTYYWRVDANNGGAVTTGAVWSFTTETGMATNPIPVDGAEDIKVKDVNIYWTPPATASSYDVYLSNSKALVEANDVSVRIANASTDPNVKHITDPLRSETYYWRVISNYPGGIKITGPTWSFVTVPYEIVFNTSPKWVTYSDQPIPGYGVMVHGSTWFSLRADGNSTNQLSESNVKGVKASDGVVVFDFNTFNYDKRFGIVAIPQYRVQDVNINDGNVPTPMAIHVHNLNGSVGSFVFDGKIKIAGNDVITPTIHVAASAGGFPGPRENSGHTSNGTSIATTSYPDRLCWTIVSIPSGTHARIGGNMGSGKYGILPNDFAKANFGPGVGCSPPYKGGSGGSYGGKGGICGRAYYWGVDGSGPTYGDVQVPVPFGGSGGGWGASAPGAPGGGGIEIVADGNVTLGVNSAILANGGNNFAATNGDGASGGGGAGGSVKIIAGTSFKNLGVIDVSGGVGGNDGSKGNNTAGGGGGGRVAIFYGTTYNNDGTITARGGDKGIYNTGTGATSSLAANGDDGTIYHVQNTASLIKKASAPTPKNGDYRVYVPAGGSTLTLKWYAGYGAASDEVYFGTVNPPVTKIGASVTSPVRGQRSATATVAVDPNRTYYFQVKSDTTVASDVWTFKTVAWQCPLLSGLNAHAAGPEWDTNGDCVLNDIDFAFFAKEWRVNRVTGASDYTLDLPELYKIMNEWLDCSNRTGTSACSGW